MSEALMALQPRMLDPSKRVRLKDFFVVFGERGREMLPRAEQVRELEVDQFHVVVFDHFADVG